MGEHRSRFETPENVPRLAVLPDVLDRGNQIRALAVDVMAHHVRTATRCAALRWR
jgi:hypothetical protein